ncbi:glycosyltransferase family 4 protein [Marinihelvus fidelis]|uniref:Glycosyltransferase family 4 protein n=1 Tax=Marinihelvus fidelis TaxID=2613842 RepID=A0A5N0TG10_9GAMM|nr:glycosyltransferase family 4 protein [Marinihelvus fidelis]KAA9133057.1 glycosyltransferase family 4 protein [Marinihelvus fidelis]
MKKILVLSVYPLGTTAGIRYRVEQYRDCFMQAGYKLEFLPFFTRNAYLSYRKGGVFKKGLQILWGMAKRIGLLVRPPRHEVLWLYRASTPTALTVFERYVTWRCKSRQVYEFDDAIWLKGPGIGALRHRLTTGSRVTKSCKKANAVIVGNQYLADYASALNASTTVIPTTVEVHHRFLPGIETREPTIVWTGSFSTLEYLERLLPVLEKVIERTGAKLKVISDVFPESAELDFECIPWSEATEHVALRGAWVGVMPLDDNAWTKGKCGFKAIQYMASGVVPVVSDVGANRDIVEDGVTGFLCATETEWEEKLIQVIENEGVRAEMSAKARDVAVRRYSSVVQCALLRHAVTGKTES